MSLEDTLSEEQRQGMIFYALKKLRPHIVKDMRKIPEQELRDGMRKIATSVLAVLEPPAELSVVDGGSNG